MTPRTAKRIAAIPSPNKDSAKTKKSKKQIVDAVTELDAGPRGRGLGSQSSQSRQDRIDKGLIIEPTYLPRFREEFALREIQADPAKYFLPRIVERDGQDFMLIAPPGLCDELLDLFRYPVKPSLTKGAGKRKQDGAAVDEEGRPDKRARSQTVESEGVGRRRDGSLGVGFDMPFPEPDYDMGAGDMTGDDFRFDIDDVLPNGHDDGAAKSRGNAWNAEREPSLDLRGGVPDLTFDMPELGDSLLSIFDEDAAATQHETQAQQDAQPATKWSKNTVKALKVLKKELEPVEEEAEAEEKTMNFGEVSQKVRALNETATDFPLTHLSPAGFSPRGFRFLLRAVGSRDPGLRQARAKAAVRRFHRHRARPSLGDHWKRGFGGQQGSGRGSLTRRKRTGWEEHHIPLRQGCFLSVSRM